MHLFILPSVIVLIVELVWQSHSNVFWVKEFEFTIQFAIRDYLGLQVAIGDFIDFLLKITFFFHHLL